MDDHEIKHALTRHVTRQEPPFMLTAEALLAAGRTRGRWRLGMTYGATTVAAAVTLTGALTVFSPAEQVSTTDGPCPLPLATGWQLPPSASPTPTPVFPTPEPTFEPSLQPTPYPTGFPGPIPTPTPPAADTSTKAVAASCFVAHELQSWLPDAKYARSFNAPVLAFYGGEYGYVAEGIIVGRDASTKLIFNVSPREQEVKFIRSAVGEPKRITVYTGHSQVYVSASGPMLTIEQLERLATAPELDLFRP